MKSLHYKRKVLLVRGAILLSASLVVATGASVGQAKQTEVPSMSVCDLAKAPEKYNGQTVTISGILSSTMHANTVHGLQCDFSVLVEGGNAKDVRDRESIEEFTHLLPQVRARHYDTDYDAPRYKITLTGRFETIYRVRKGNLVPIGHGFGDRGLFPNRLILQRVDELPKL